MSTSSLATLEAVKMSSLYPATQLNSKTTQILFPKKVSPFLNQQLVYPKPHMLIMYQAQIVLSGDIGNSCT